MRSGDTIVEPGADRRAAPRPVPGSSPTSEPAGGGLLGPVRAGPGYSPWKDPTVLLLLVISLVAAALFVGGATFGPALSGGGGGGVFPVIDILTGDDGGDGTSLSLEANRSELQIGEPVAFTVTDGNDTPARNASVSIGGATYAADESGRVVVLIDRAGQLSATATAPGANDSTRESNEVAISVAPRPVQLAVRANRSVATAGEPIALTLVRDDIGTAVRGSIATRFVAEGDHLPAGGIQRHNGSQSVVVPDRAGRLIVVGTREDSGGETYHAHVGTVAVERRTVGLDVSVAPSEIVAGESVTATVRRADTDQPVAATLTVGSRTIETGVDGRAAVPFDAADTATIRATAAQTPAVSFAPGEARVTVERREVPLALSVAPAAITDGGRVTATVTRTDTGEPIEGTVTVAGQSVQTGSNGTATVEVASPGQVEIVASAPDTPTETFTSAAETITVPNATIDLDLLDAPASVAPGESFSIEVRATNRGPEAGTDTLRFQAGAETVADRTVSLAPGNRTVLSFETTAPDAPDELVVGVRGSDGSIEATIDVEE
ncbi:hypothetical protein L593_08145 [Salinarchaeum sp. Harcht-Bsk1]|uniref:hypothetical protein n=1 Tax=Salinarchaeum sp. Harcht-Bsk1 TaxID=1333523 RepID=UPI0003423FFB|nr:hypothetical protein [Salinarchaeum sp. Harcht-Bsk1]AGN01574.1 hypothetical protein L593_08145 [Salinarchaeum sp. Harcht-Bsk1]